MSQQVTASGFGRATVPREPLVLPRLPITMHVAFWLQLAVLAVGAVSIVVLQLDAFNVPVYVAHAQAEAARKHERIFSASTYASGFVLEVVDFCIVLALFVGLALLVRRGFNWARIVLTVVIVGTFVESFVPFTGVDALGVIRMAADVATVVLVWLPASSRYFREARAARRARKASRLVIQR